MTSVTSRSSASFVACGIISALLANPAAGGSYAFLTLQDPNATNGTFASGINDAGTVVGRYGLGFVNQGFIYQGGQYTTFDVNGAPTALTSINNAGTIAGYYSDANGPHGFTMAGSTLTTIDDPNAVHGTFVFGINNQGAVTGYYYDTNFVAHGFSLSGTTFTPIDVPGAGAPAGETPGTFAQGINDSGRVVGGAFGPHIGSVGFLFDGTNYTNFTVPGSSSTFGAGINDAGDIVGHDFASGFHGFVNIGGTYTTIDDPNSFLGTMPSGINGSGVIVGSFLDANAHAFGFIATPAAVPEPSTLALALVGALTLLAARSGTAMRRIASRKRRP
jgi:hypothetical protein